MSIIDKANEIKNKIISLQKEGIPDYEISDILADNLKEYLESTDKEKNLSDIVKSIQIINSTGINKEADIFTDAGLNINFDNSLSAEFLIKYFKDTNETINYNGSNTPKSEVARKILALNNAAYSLYLQLIFEQEIERNYDLKRED